MVSVGRPARTMSCVVVLLTRVPENEMAVDEPPSVIFPVYDPEEVTETASNPTCLGGLVAVAVGVARPVKYPAAEGFTVTVTVSLYVFFVVPFCAVTTMVM